MKTITLLTQLSKFRKDSKLTAQKVKELSRQRFTSLLEKAFHSSVFYRDLYSSHGIKSTDLKDVSLKDLPIISRTMVLDNFDSLITDPSITRKSVEEFLINDKNPQNRFRGNTVMHTSGTTGVPGIFVYSKQEWSFIAALVVARISQPVFRPFNKLRLAFLGKTGGHYAGVTLLSDAPKYLYKTDFFNPENIEKLISGLNDFQPDIISGYASTIYQLALAKLDGRLNIMPGRLQSSGEVLTDNMRQIIEQAFSQDVFNLYACCESIVMGIQKSGKEPFYLFNDWHLFETIDENDNLVPEGTQGSLLITPLYRTLQPLIRYRLSDTVALIRNEQQPFISLNRFSGRTGDSLTYLCPQGKEYVIHPYDMLAFYIPGLRQFQFEQTSPKSLLLRISVLDGYSEAKQIAEKKLKEILVKTKIENFVTGKVELVDAIGINVKTGKFKTVIPYNHGMCQVK